MKSKNKQFLATIIVTSVLSLIIGGFAIWSTYQNEISLIDSDLETIVLGVHKSPNDPISAALLSAEENSFDVTVAFISASGEIATLRDSKTASLDSPNQLRIRYIPLENSERLIVAESIVDIQKSLKDNIWRLLIFVLIANSLASFASLLINRSGALVLERAHREKMQEFLGDAAHELRTPLTVVKGYTELLRDGKLGEDRQKVAFERLNSEIARMQALINDLLVLAELGEKKNLEYSLLDLSSLMRENVRDFQVLSPNHQVKLNIEEDITFKGSREHLQRMLSNALTNIRVHTPENTPVRVSLMSGKSIKLIIEDGGPGLPDHYYGEKVRSLERFDRSRSRETGGSGLGLSIISAVVAQHGGTLSLRKSELGGLAIEVQLPRT